MRGNDCNYSGTPIFWYNTDFIGLIFKTEKFEYLIRKFKNQWFQ